MYPEIEYEGCDCTYNCNHHHHVRPAMVLYNTGSSIVTDDGTDYNATFTGSIFDNGFMTGNITYVKTVDGETKTIGISIANTYTNTHKEVKTETTEGSTTTITTQVTDTYVVADGNGTNYSVVCNRTETDTKNVCECECCHPHFPPLPPPPPMPFGNYYPPREIRPPFVREVPPCDNYYPNNLVPFGLPYEEMIRRCTPYIHVIPPNNKHDFLPHPHYVDLREKPIYDSIYGW